MKEAAPYLIFAGIVGILVAWRVNKNLLIGMKKEIDADPVNKGMTAFVGSCMSAIVLMFMLCALICAGFGTIGMIQP